MAIDFGVNKSIIHRIIMGNTLVIVSFIPMILSREWVQDQLFLFTILAAWFLCVLIVAYTCDRRRHRILYEIAKWSKKTDTPLDVEEIANKARRSRVMIPLEQAITS
jgi:hypothetical protein